ncbi:hypothetical protein [Clostridium tyrobutyricum]|uniref:hypothetical protein n=1 Tax=Clostridium tyrobutyricum TaxID=1519 RepID=UPI001C38B5B5|nr:hypothetical protein [Clostridium tyrobutyricum]MBV4416534.1 hypothetical protein [Clostridium tyrobutyricum]
MKIIFISKNKKSLRKPKIFFDSKIKIYSGLTRENDRFEGITNFRITQKIVDDYSSNKYQNGWNESSIIDRRDWLIDQITGILEIDTTK